MRARPKRAIRLDNGRSRRILMDVRKYLSLKLAQSQTDWRVVEDQDEDNTNWLPSGRIWCGWSCALLGWLPGILARGGGRVLRPWAACKRASDATPGTWDIRHTYGSC